MAINEKILAELEARGGAAMAATFKAVEGSVTQLGRASLAAAEKALALSHATEILSKSATLAGGGLAVMARETKKVAASVVNIDHAVGAAERGLAGLAVTATVTAKALDRVQDQAFQAGGAIREMGIHAAAATLKFSAMGAVVGGVGLAGFAAGAGVVTAGLAAMYAAAGAATGAFLGFGVWQNVISEASPLQDAIKRVNKELEKLEEKGITSGPAYDKLKANLAELQAQYDRTFMGMVDSLKRFAVEASKTISKPLFDVLKVQLERLVAYVNSPVVQSQIPKLTKRVADGIITMTAWFERSKPALMAWGRAILMIGEALSGPVLVSLKLFLSGFSQVNSQGAAFQQNISQIARITQFFGQMMAISSTILNGLVGGIVRGLAPALDSLAGSLAGVIDRAGGMAAFLDRVSLVATTIGRSLGAVIGAVLKFGVAVGKAANTLGLWRFLYQGIVKGSALIVKGLDKAGAIVNVFADRIAGGVPKVISKIVELFKVFSPLAIAFRAFQGFLSGGIDGALASFGDSFSNIGAILSGLASKIGPILITLGKSIVQTLGSILPAIISTVTQWGLALLGWVEPYLPSIISALLNLVGRIGVWVLSQVPMLIGVFTKWGLALVGWILPTIPPILIALGRAISTIISWTLAQVPALTNTLIKWAVAFLDWAVPLAGQITAVLLRVVTAILNSVANNLPAIIAKLQSWAMAFWSWVGPTVPGLIDALGNLAGAVGRWVVSKAPTLATALGAWSGAFGRWVLHDLVPKIPGFLISVVHGVLNFLNTAFQSAGVDLSPLFSRIGTAFDGAIRIALDSFNTFKAALAGEWTNAPGINGFTAMIGNIGLLLHNVIIPGFAAWGPKVLEVASAFNPLSIALAALQGFMTGGLSGAIDALTDKFVNAGKVVGVDLTGLFNTISGIVKNVVIPIFNSLANTVTTVIMPALSKFWAESGPQVLNILKQVGSFISETLIPALGKIANTFLTVVLPAVVDFMDNGLKTMLPIFKGVIDMGVSLFEKLAPFTPLLLGIVAAIELIKGIQTAWAIATGVVTAAQWLLNVALTANPIGLIVVGIAALIAAGVLLAANWDTVTKVFGDGWNWINDHVIKPFGDAIGGLVNGVGSGFGWVGEQIGNIWINIQNAAVRAWEFINNNVFKPIGQAVDTLRSVFVGIGDAIKSGFRSAINFVIGGLNVLIRGANTLIDGLNSVNPFGRIGHIGELGLAQFAKGGIATRATPGIFGEAGPEAILPIDKIVPLFARAMRQITLPAMQQAQPVMAPPSPNQIYNNSRSNVSSYTDARQWNLGGVTTQQSTGSVMSDFGMLQAMGW